MEFSDKTLTCRECSKPFVWTAGEQAFYKDRQLINIPARCTECRSNRKERLGLQRQPITEVVCAECGLTTTVPFVPRNGRPVYCSTCLAGVRAQEESRQPSTAATSV
ncbi:MAG TPA: zinc-ribbon domain containing protein [Thermomicrobiales bacterium]|nr:zinc-ribbon domain containing protein [Thermomicrobiales bacterium]